MADCAKRQPMLCASAILILAVGYTATLTVMAAAAFTAKMSTADNARSNARTVSRAAYRGYTCPGSANCPAARSPAARTRIRRLRNGLCNLQSPLRISTNGVAYGITDRQEPCQLMQQQGRPERLGKERRSASLQAGNFRRFLMCAGEDRDGRPSVARHLANPLAGQAGR